MTTYDESGTSTDPYAAPSYSQPGPFPHQAAPSNLAYGPYIPVPPPVAMPEKDNHALATAGMVIGIVATVLSLIPLIGMVSWLLSPTAIILSVFGRNSSKKGQAKAGMILGSIALFICVLWTIGMVAFGIAMSSQSCGYNSLGNYVCT
jgi:hypothetical protein